MKNYIHFVAYSEEEKIKEKNTGFSNSSMEPIVFFFFN